MHRPCSNVLMSRPDCPPGGTVVGDGPTRTRPAPEWRELRYAGRRRARVNATTSQPRSRGRSWTWPIGRLMCATDWGGRHRHDAELRAGPVVGSHPPVAPLGGDQDTGVADDAHAGPHRAASDEIGDDAPACPGELVTAERTMLGFPLLDGSQTVTDEQGSPSGLGHPRRHAHALGGSGGDDPLVEVGVMGDRELRRRPSAWHPRSLPPTGTPQPCTGWLDRAPARRPHLADRPAQRRGETWRCQTISSSSQPGCRTAGGGARTTSGARST